MLQKLRARIEALEARKGAEKGPVRVSLVWVDVNGEPLPGQPQTKPGAIVLNFG